MPLIEGLAEPQFGDREKIEQDNLDYSKPLAVPLDKTKKDLQNLFGSFQNSNEKTNIDSSINLSEEVKYDEQKDILLKKKIDEGEKSPLIDGLVGQGFLTIEEGEIVKNALLENGNILDKINNIEEIDKEKKGQILDTLQYIENSKENFIEKFNNNFTNDIEELKTGEVGKKTLSEGQQRLLDKIGGNYFTVGAESGTTETTKEGLNRALKITLNELINNKQFKEPENFDNIRSNILDGNLNFKLRFEQLQKIEIQIVNSTSSIIGKQSKVFQKGQESIKNQNIITEEKVAEYKTYIKESILNKDILKLQEMKDELVDIKKELPKGDIIESGVIDLINEINDFIGEQV